ncbi:swr complex subunit [Pestalotiopsis sp. IQ-011]
MHRPVTPNNPSRRLSNSSTTQDGEAYRTALRGASLAFQRTGPTSNGAASDTLRNNDKGAAMAAHNMSRQTTGNSVQDGTNHGRSLPVQTTGGQAQGTQNSAAASLLKPPGRLNVATDPRATSFIAATLAASRSASPSPNHRPQARPSNNAQPGAPGKKKSSPASSVTSLDLATDTMSIPPTNALISMFEKNHDGRSPSKNRDPIKKPNKPRPLTPPRDVGSGQKVVAKPSPSSPRQARNAVVERLESPPALSRKTQNEKPQEAKLPPLVVKKKPAPLPLASKPLQHAADTNADSVQQAMAKTRNRASMPPQPASKVETPILSPQPRRAASHKMVRPLPPPELQKDIPRKPAPPVKPKPQPRTTQESSSQPAAKPQNIPEAVPQPPIEPVSQHSTGSSDDTFVSASSVQTSRAPSPNRGRSPAMVSDPPPEIPLRTRPRSVQSLATDSISKSRNPAPPPPRRSQQPNNNMTLNHLTDATMAGILASRTPLCGSAAPSPRPPSVPPPRKKTPLMRQTLRKPRSDSSDEDEKWKARHKTKPLQSKKKHSHHEGARKRWREEITERERRRYEGVWASNRGRLLVSPDTDTNGSSQPTTTSSPANGGNGNADLVVNIIVRDIWSRSRLPREELIEVWDLVDSTGRGALTKVEFVVGMWLIDQRLKGRKIPQKVTDSVWTSARGVSVKGPPKDKGKVKHKH